MKLAFCVACGSKEDLQHHHLVMRSESGSEAEVNLITLCRPCHDKVHERQHQGAYNHSKRVTEAQQAAKVRGVKLGRKRKLSNHQRAEAIKRRAAGETLASIAKSYAVDLSMISRL